MSYFLDSLIKFAKEYPFVLLAFGWMWTAFCSSCPPLPPNAGFLLTWFVGFIHSTHPAKAIQQLLLTAGKTKE